MWRRALQSRLPARALLIPVTLTLSTRQQATCQTPPAPVQNRDFLVFRRRERALKQKPQSPEPLAERADWTELLKAATDGSVEVLLLGEVHTDDVCHMLQLQVLEHCEAACRQSGRRLVLSLEMFETDVQRPLDEYVTGRIREQDFTQDSRPWPNYEQHYRPLVEFCRQKDIRVVAANAPRRYVSLVARSGLDALERLFESQKSEYEGLGLPPLPLPAPSPSYVQKFIETIASQLPPSEPGAKGECPFIGFRGDDVRGVKREMMEAQLLWDHTMAHSIARAAKSYGTDTLPPLVVHVCGAFHCAHGLGIPEVLSQMKSPPQTSGSCCWLPIDDITGSRAEQDGADAISAKENPSGVLTAVFWPASVAGTQDVVEAGNMPRSLGLLGDWVVITEE